MSISRRTLWVPNEPLIEIERLLRLGAVHSEILLQSIQVDPEPLSANTSGQANQQQPQ